MHAECCDACLLPLSLSLTSWRAAAAAMLNALLWSALSMAAATKEGRSTSCCERARAMGVYEETEFDCCRLIAPQGATAWTERENCTMLPAYTCFHNSKNKITTKTHVGDDPGVCCTACKNEKGCVSWTHQTKDHGKCELYSTVGPARSNDRDGCSAGTIGPHGPIKPAPPGPPPHPPHPAPPSPPSPTPQPVTPRGDKPNILFLVVESTDGRTWSPGYQNDAIKLPNFRELQKGGLNFRRHYANAPVCCPSRATFWSGRHASNLAHVHPGYGNISVPGALNNFEGLPVGFSHRIDQVLPALTDYKVKVSGKTDWDTGGHSENVHLDAWTMYAAWPYDIAKMGGWQEENGCVDPGRVAAGGNLINVTNGHQMSNQSLHSGDWKTAQTTTEWITEVSKDKAVPWFAFQGMNIVHPPYRTNQHWFNQIDQDAVEVPAWTPLEEMHPCDLQSSMLKGCTPVPNASDPNDFYTEKHRRYIRTIYYAMIAEFDAMVGKYMDTVKAAGVWNQTVTIVTSDHGDMQMEHQQFYKMVPYDASASVPMIIHDARPGRQNPKLGPEIHHPTQLIDIFPTILTLVQVPEAKWPKLDGYSLTPLMAVSSDEQKVEEESTALAPGANRPDFVVSQFHGDNIAMSWYLVVKEGVSMPAPAQAGSGSVTTYKLIIWGTGKEVASLLFDLVNDPMENTNLIKDAAGLAKYESIVASMEQDLRSVVDYPAFSLAVATYGKEMMRRWMKNEPDWKTEIHKQGLRWTPSWNYDSDAAFAALAKYMSSPPAVVPCRNVTVTPK